MIKFQRFSSRQTGAFQETKALKLLERNGCICVFRNFSSRYGEIDLIVTDKNHVLVFVEVRSRHNLKYGTPAETVSIYKQARIKKTAAFFLSTNPSFGSYQCRFDVIAICTQQSSAKDSISWIKNAFS